MSTSAVAAHAHDSSGETGSWNGSVSGWASTRSACLTFRPAEKEDRKPSRREKLHAGFRVLAPVSSAVRSAVLGTRPDRRGRPHQYPRELPLAPTNGSTSPGIVRGEGTWQHIANFRVGQTMLLPVASDRPRILFARRGGCCEDHRCRGESLCGRVPGAIQVEPPDVRRIASLWWVPARASLSDSLDRWSRWQ